MGAVPAGTAAFACWGGNGPQRTHSSLLSPPTPATAPHHKSPLVTFPAGSQPASSKNASITNKNLPLRSPVPLSLSLIHTYTHTHTHTHTHMRTHSDPCHSFTVCWLGRRPEVTSCLGNSGGPGQVLLLAIPSPPPSGQENYFRLFFVLEALKGSVSILSLPAAFHSGC